MNSVCPDFWDFFAGLDFFADFDDERAMGFVACQMIKTEGICCLKTDATKQGKHTQNAVGRPRGEQV